MTGERYRVAAALRALAAPLTIGSLALLALNDHVLKQAWPASFVTGKLSDASGLVVAPVLLTLLLALIRVPRPAPVAVVATGIGFAWVKTTYVGAEVASAVWTWVWGSSLVLRDPTDLLALPALAVAWTVLRRARAAHHGGLAGRGLRGRVSAGAAALVLPFALVAVAATSACSGPGDANTTVNVVTGRWDDQEQGRERRFVVTGNYAGRLSVDRDGTIRTMTANESRRLRGAGPGFALVCDPADDRACWRVPSDWSVPEPERVPRIERTRDGGRTWTEEYAMPLEQRKAVQARVGETCGEPTPVRIRQLALMRVPDGVVVAVAVTGADLLQRTPAGHWTQHYGEPVVNTAQPPPARRGRGSLRVVGPDRPPVLGGSPSPSSPSLPAACASPVDRDITPHPRNRRPAGREECPTNP